MPPTQILSRLSWNTKTSLETETDNLNTIRNSIMKTLFKLFISAILTDWNMEARASLLGLWGDSRYTDNTIQWSKFACSQNAPISYVLHIPETHMMSWVFADCRETHAPLFLDNFAPWCLVGFYTGERNLFSSFVAHKFRCWTMEGPQHPIDWRDTTAGDLNVAK